MSTQPRGSNGGKEGRECITAYATLLTRPSYLAGALLLAYTLHAHSPATPLIILYTPETMPEAAIAALSAEAKYTGALLHPVEHLRLPAAESGNDGEGNGESGMVAERFIDTWTKLRVFEVLEVQGRSVDRLCFLDADMMIFKDPSQYIFTPDNDAYLEEGDGMRLCATHICVCNLDHDAWAPAEWIPENCAHTHVHDPDSIPPVKSHPATMSEMNTGAFAFHPSPALARFVLDAFTTTSPSTLRAMKFPDQDFLNKVFEGRWKSINWRVNALKTWRYWHPRMWRDDAVAVLHYIVDKPWAARVSTSADKTKIAGYKGDDGETHSWWWDAHARWVEERRAQGETELLATASKYVASEDGGDSSEEMRAVGGGAQAYAKKWEGKGEADGDGEGDEEKQSVTGNPPPGQQDFGAGPHGRIIRKPMFGERGHGRVVRGG